MQIRLSPYRIRLVRTVYDPAIGRGRSVSLGSLPAHATHIPPELAARLRPAEHAQLSQLLAERAAVDQRQRAARAARALPETLAAVARWYLEQPKGAEDLRALAEATRTQYSAVLEAMCKAGVGRTRKRRGGAASTAGR